MVSVLALPEVLLCGVGTIVTPGRLSSIPVLENVGHGAVEIKAKQEHCSKEPPCIPHIM